ncbi:MAG: DUF2145 domain-containing protein [Bdellovibrionales bacterium]|nr:DUF2145 domain-containing protein [Bdellovibrionales bacterium]
MRGFIFVCGIFFCFQSYATSLLSQAPRSYSTYGGFGNKKSTCHNLISSTRQYLNSLKKKGHQVALIFNNGSAIPLPKYRIKDQFHGRTYNNINDLVEVMEDWARRKTSWSEPEEYQKLVGRCLRGRKITGLDKKAFPESCVEPMKARHLHSGFVVLNSGTSKAPFMIHLYGDEKYNFLKASLRVETLESYLKEEKMQLCEAKIATLKPSDQKRILNFFKGNHAERLLAKGNKNFNLLTNPWKVKTQNCNAWTSEALATMLFEPQNQWKRANRHQAKQILWQTGFRPYKIPLGPLQSLARLPALFVGGIDMEEGNIDHFHGVADVIPTEAIQDWLKRHGKITSAKLIKGKY